jgi:NTE family protein
MAAPGTRALVLSGGGVGGIAWLVGFIRGLAGSGVELAAAGTPAGGSRTCRS